MRRGYKIIEGELLPPFAENLVFWAPLTEGDLTDHISGVELKHTDESYVKYDSSMNAYQFFKKRKPDYNGWDTSILFDAVNFPKGLKKEATQGYTITALCKRSYIQKYNYPPYVVLGLYTNNDTWRPSIAFSNDEPSSIKEQFARRTFVYDNGIAKRFINGELVLQGNSESLANYISQNTDVGNYIGVNLDRDGKDTNQKPWIADIRIYNRALTASEVAQL